MRKLEPAEKLNIRSAGFRLRFVGLISCLFFISCAAGLPKKEKKPPASALMNLAVQIDSVLDDSLLLQAHTGLKIVSLENGDVLYARDSGKLFNPASNMKLLTTAAGLERLGPDFRFCTAVYADSGAADDSVLHGNLYLKGYGNPDLTTDDLGKLVDDLHQYGVERIDGNLLCDESYFDDFYRGEGWMWDDASSWYFAPIGALTVNDNCVTVIVRPAKNVGDSLLISFDPPIRYLQIENHAVTVDSTDSLRLEDFKVERKWKNPENTVVIDGGLAAGAPPESVVVDVMEPALYVGTLFKELLQRVNIRLDGHVAKGITPQNAETLLVHQSEPLSLAVRNTNKISDNLSAEQILKTLGAEIRGIPGTAPKGVSVVKAFLQETGVDSNSYYIVDGSGVSRYDLVSPDLLVELLRRMYRDFQVQPEYVSSLPVAGVDGTLEKRMRNGPADEKVRAKTGSLRGVSSLSGYATTADGELVAFSMIMADFVKPASQIRKLQDRICDLITAFSRKTPIP